MVLHKKGNTAVRDNRFVQVRAFKPEKDCIQFDFAATTFILRTNLALKNFVFFCADAQGNGRKVLFLGDKPHISVQSPKGARPNECHTPELRIQKGEPQNKPFCTGLISGGA